MSKEESIEVTYRAGYLVPTKPDTGMFSAQRDTALIAQGTHFFCLGHLCAVPVASRYIGTDYCRQCWEIVKTA